MGIVSLKFFIFIAITLITYYFCPPKSRWIVLLAANVGFFLANSSVALFGIFVAMSLVTWVAALGVKSAHTERLKTAVTAVTVLALMATLIMYKEISFFIVNSHLLERVSDISLGWTMPDWIAPLGISYFALILIGYLLDVRWGTIDKPQGNPLKMLLFAGYFPHMTSGPFTRYNDVKDTLLLGDVRYHFGSVYRGVQRIIWGVFKVLIISTRLSVLVDTIYNAQLLPQGENHYAGLPVIVGAMLYVLNVYMNFSGSMDIVIGISEMFGIPLAENFQRPFSATSLSEVWRRWHMTLGFFLKDYVLYPTLKSGWLNKIRIFCKKRFGKKAARDIPTYIGMLITWFCVGFWHGGSWKYICASGLFFFVMIVGGLILSPLFKRIIKMLRINTECFSWRGFQRVRTFCLFSLSVSFGRAASLTVGLKMWQSVFTTVNASFFSYGSLLNLGLTKDDLLFVFAGLAVVFWVSHLQQRYGSVRDLLAEQNIVFRIGVVVVFVFLIVYIGGIDNKIDFIYGNF
jgi:D-alanyl-lipoteichoic acid acyltransferase DltB (MBOAT superfamily)